MGPQPFELEKDLKEILKLVLDQELQKYNLLIGTMTDTLQAALNVIDGKSLVTNQIEEFIEAVEEGEIPQPWLDVAYPTMADLEGFLADLKERTDFLRDWQVNGPPRSYWLTALFEPGDFLIAIMYMAALDQGVSFHELGMECQFSNISPGSEEEGKDDGPGILARGLYLVGAAWDAEANVLVEADRQSIAYPMPVFRLVPILEDKMADRKCFSCPLFQVSAKNHSPKFR